MISQFRSLNPVNLILLCVIAIILRTGVLLSLPASIAFSPFEPYTALLLKVPSDLFTPFSNVFYATVLVLIQAVLFNRIVNGYNLLAKPSFVPALMYVTLSAVLEPFVVLSPALVVNFLVLWIIEKFLSVYRREDALAVLFDIGMIIAVGTLIYFPFIGMLPMLWVSLIIFRPFNWREWIAGIVGFITVAFLVGILCYLNDSLYSFFNVIPTITPFRTGFKVNLYDYTVLIPVLLILALSLLTLRTKLYRSSVHVRKSFFILSFLIGFTFLSFYLTRTYTVHHFIMAVPSVSVLTAHFFLTSSKKWLYESLYLVLAVFIIYFQFV